MTYRFGRGARSAHLLRRPSGVVVGGDAFTPASLTGVALWLDADSTYITLDPTNVSAWADRSGNGNDFQQTTSARRPAYTASNATVGGAPTVDFDRANSEFLEEVTSQALDPSAGTPVTVMACIVSDGTPNGTLFSNKVAAGAGLKMFFTGGALTGVIEEAGGENVTATGVGTHSTSGAYYERLVFDGGTDAEVWEDGSSLASATDVTMDGDSISGGAWTIGAYPTPADHLSESIAELIVMHAVPTAGELASLTAYWNAKFSLSKGGV